MEENLNIGKSISIDFFPVIEKDGFSLISALDGKCSEKPSAGASLSTRVEVRSRCSPGSGSLKGVVRALAQRRAECKEAAPAQKYTPSH